MIRPCKPELNMMISWLVIRCHVLNSSRIFNQFRGGEGREVCEVKKSIALQTKFIDRVRFCYIPLEMILTFCKEFNMYTGFICSLLKKKHIFFVPYYSYIRSESIRIRLLFFHSMGAGCCCWPKTSFIFYHSTVYYYQLLPTSLPV